MTTPRDDRTGRVPTFATLDARLAEIQRKTADMAFLHLDDLAAQVSNMVRDARDELVKLEEAYAARR